MARRAAVTESTEEEVVVIKSALDKEMDSIDKDYGLGSVNRRDMIKEKLDVISTGSFGLDRATGIGGFARGKLTELIGWESSGKSTITLQIIANAQKQGLKCMLIDAEFSFDATYAKALGIDVDEMIVLQIDEGGAEKMYNIANRLMRTKGIGVCVVDSQTALLPKKAFDGEIGDSKLGLHARLNSEAVPMLVGAASIGNTALIFISQLREKIGVMFGSPETTSGGNALKFYSHMRVDFRKSLIKDPKTEEVIANKTICKVIKNKMAPPYRKAEFEVVFGKGVNTNKEILDLAVEFEIIKKAGSWYSYESANIGQGADSILQMFDDNEEFRVVIETAVKAKLI